MVPQQNTNPETEDQVLDAGIQVAEDAVTWFKRVIPFLKLSPKYAIILAAFCTALIALLEALK